MAPIEKSCGTCGWSSPIQDQPERVDCDWAYHNATPDCVPINSSYMFIHQGTHCPCWKAKKE